MEEINEKNPAGGDLRDEKNTTCQLSNNIRREMRIRLTHIIWDFFDTLHR